MESGGVTAAGRLLTSCHLRCSENRESILSLTGWADLISTITVCMLHFKKTLIQVVKIQSMCSNLTHKRQQNLNVLDFGLIAFVASRQLSQLNLPKLCVYVFLFYKKKANKHHCYI